MTSTFLGVINPFAFLNVPFNTIIGRKDDKKNAG